MPYDMLQEVEELARSESRTMSELVREALRQYKRQRRWEEINAYGRAQAKRRGIRPEDAVRLVREFREDQREAKPKVRRPAK